MAHVLRARFPEHRVCRADVCEDFDEPGAFDSLLKAARTAKPAKVVAGFDRLPDDATAAKTWSCGKRSGEGYLRIYEKGKSHECRHEHREDWVRMEFEIKPHYGAQRIAAARMSPAEVIGIVPWCSRMASKILSVPIPRYEPRHREQSHDRTMLYQARTYRNALTRELRGGKDWAQLGAEFEGIWASDDREGAKSGIDFAFLVNCAWALFFTARSRGHFSSNLVRLIWVLAFGSEVGTTA